jgi:hypothetical protein
MNSKTCEEIRELLIDLADGQEVPEAAEHLARCEECRKILSALKRSLSLAGEVWKEREAGFERVSIPSRPRLGYKRGWIAAAGILLLITISQFIKPLAVRPEEPQRSLSEITSLVNNSGISAQLLAAAEMLAQNPEGLSQARKQYEYILTYYPDTPSANQARSQLYSLSERKGEL